MKVVVKGAEVRIPVVGRVVIFAIYKNESILEGRDQEG